MKYITSLVLLITLFSLSACGSLRPDPAPTSAIDASYPTLEMYVDGSLFHGAAVVYKADTNFDFEVQGYYSGELRVTSVNCGFDKTVNYENNQRVKIDLSSVTIPVRNCFFVAKMTPSYPGEAGSGIKISAIVGILAFKRKVEERQAYATPLKVMTPPKGFLTVPVGDVPSARILINGCNGIYDHVLKPDSGKVTIPLEEIFSSAQGYCVADGVVITDQLQDLLVYLAGAVYAQSYTPLSIPSISIKGGKIRVVSEEAVSIVSVDNEYKLSNKGTFDFDPSKPGHVVRAITVKGRTALGVWDGKEFRWMQ